MTINTESPIGLKPVDKQFPITSKFGELRTNLSDKLSLKSKFHKGVDFGSHKGGKGNIVESIEGKQVYAYRDGKVSICHDNGDGFGLRVWIDHENRRDGYCHLKTAFINVGDMIKQGQVIALVGNTGKSTAPHLHFETRLNGEAVEPLFYEETKEV